MILVVDDDQAVIDVLGVAITHAGYRVETAHNGTEAYDHLKHPECKCMLLDINMPRINGIELLLLMQADDIHIPTILMAGVGDFEKDELKQFEDVVTFMRKPLKMNEVVDAIRQVALPPSTG